MNKPNKFLNITQKGKVAQIDIYGEITDTDKDFFGMEDGSVGAKELKEQLNALDGVDEIKIYINSPGGSVFAGQAIYSMLSRYPAKKTVFIDGIAASAASIIAMVGDEIIMPRNSMMMIHKAWTLAVGNSDDLMSVAETLEKIEQSLLAVYVDKTGLDKEVVYDMMKKETWMTAEEAVALKFATKIEETRTVTASIKDSGIKVNDMVFETKDLANFDELSNKIEKTVDKPDETNNNIGINGAELAAEIQKFIKIMED